MDTYCRFVGCVAFGESRPFRTAEGERQVILCSGHAKHVYDAHHNPEKRVEYDEQSGRIRVVPAPPIHDHESERVNVAGVLDVVAERELKRHAIEPHGDWRSDMRAFHCRTCDSVMAAPVDLIAHLDRAVDRAIADALKAVQQSKE